MAYLNEPFTQNKSFPSHVDVLAYLKEYATKHKVKNSFVHECSFWKS